MKFFAKCVTVFIVLTALLAVGDELLLETALPLSGTLLFSAFASLLITLLYGWIDAVYVQQRQSVWGTNGQGSRVDYQESKK